MFGLTALDYAEASGVQEYIDIIKQIHPNAMEGILEIYQTLILLLMEGR